MMRWNYTDNAVETSVAQDETRSLPAEERELSQSPAQHLIDAALSFMSLLGPRSVAVAVLVAFVFAALVLGLTADDAMATSRWCLKCG